MGITASQVKELRESTGVGMMECKRALQETEGDLKKAILYLRERGLSRAAKKAGRIAAEGLIEVFVNEDANLGVVIELNCETDFAAKNADFQKLAKDIASVTLKTGVTDVEKLKEQELDGSTVGQTLTDLIAKIGENMNLRRASVVKTDNGTIVGYNHMGGKIGALVLLEGAKNDQTIEMGKDIAMHIAAANPRYLHRDEVDKGEIEQERELGKKKLIEQKKPENIMDKILDGQINKFFKEICLVDQLFVKDTSVSIGKHVEESKLGVTVAKFHRFQLGEGIEKKAENFAEEVAAQINK